MKTNKNTDFGNLTIEFLKSMIENSGAEDASLISTTTDGYEVEISVKKLDLEEEADN